jgi:hypothetical protein
MHIDQFHICLKSVYQKEIKKMKRKLVETDSADSSDDRGVT